MESASNPSLSGTRGSFRGLSEASSCFVGTSVALVVSEEDRLQPAEPAESAARQTRSIRRNTCFDMVRPHCRTADTAAYPRGVLDRRYSALRLSKFTSVLNNANGSSSAPVNRKYALVSSTTRNRPLLRAA